MSWRRIVLLAFAIVVFAVLFVPIPTMDIAINLPPAPSAEQVRINRGILGAVVGIVFLLVYFGLRRRRLPPQ